MHLELNSKIPDGPVEQKWAKHKASIKLITPSNKRKYSIIVVGTGLAGASAAASFGELGYRVKAFCFQDSPRRAHSIAAQGGINAAKNYQNDGDSVFRLFYDTVKGGDFRAREANVYRLAELSVSIIDQCVAQGVPFAREYSGLLSNRSFGGAQVSRTFYAKGQTGQQLLLGAYAALNRQIHSGAVQMNPHTEMLDLIVSEGRCKGIVTRNLRTGKMESHVADAVVLATGGYSNVFYLSTNAMGCNVTSIWRAYRHGAGMANPCFTQIHPTSIPVHGEHQSKLTLMSESLRNDGRVWVPKKQGDTRAPHQIPEDERDYYLERRYPSFGNLSPRDIASRAAKERCDAGFGVGSMGLGVYLDFADAIKRLGRDAIEARYGNLFVMYDNISGENPYEVPMRIYPAPHYTMGGLWVDYNLMSNIPKQCRDIDQPQAALVEDLAARGLLDETLVVWAGEFGRTVYGQGGLVEDYGRDHHGRCFSIWLAGGGVKPGVVHGVTDDYGYNIVQDPVHIHDLNATLLHCLGVDHERLTYRFQGRDYRLTDVHGHVVKGILG